VVLTHGTVLVDGDREEMFRALRVPAPKLGKRSLKDPGERVTTLREELGRLPPMDEVERAVILGFKQAFGAEAVSGRPTAAEKAMAEELTRTRYGNPEWNLGRGRRCSTE